MPFVSSYSEAVTAAAIQAAAVARDDVRSLAVVDDDDNIRRVEILNVSLSSSSDEHSWTCN
jgi:hypothetical protein